jgi:hypothetical protein
MESEIACRTREKPLRQPIGEVSGGRSLHALRQASFRFAGANSLAVSRVLQLMSKLGEYLHQANVCGGLARTAPGEDHRAMLKQMEESWLDLALERLRTNPGEAADLDSENLQMLERLRTAPSVSYGAVPVTRTRPPRKPSR